MWHWKGMRGAAVPYLGIIAINVALWVVIWLIVSLLHAG